MKQWILAWVVMTGSFTMASPTLVRTVAPSADLGVIPFQAYQFDNGLRLVIHEDHRNPIVHVQVMYHVGSARETPGKSGFAHFFEHMMFQGSKHVPYNRHFELVTQAGGRMNGSASRDRTNYYQTVPSEFLETVLWLESDRMGFFLDGISQEKFEIQRDTVKNEKAQNYDNRPYGLVGQYLYRAHYPQGHPYSWLTIGEVSDLDRVTVDDLKSFFSTWYRPNNATIVIAGDVSPNQVVNWVDAYFGPIPSGPVPPKATPWIPTLTQQPLIVTVDHRIQLPLVMMVYPTPPRYHLDEPALDALAFYLGGSAASRLHAGLVRTNLAASVSAYHDTSELAGEFVISVTPYPTASISEIDRVIRSVLEDIAKSGLPRGALNPFLAKHRMDTLMAMDSVDTKAGYLVTNATLAGDPGFLAIEAKRYQQVTPGAVSRVLNQYIHQKPATIFAVVPPQHPLVSTATWVERTRPTVDRTQQPIVPTPSQVQSLPIWRQSIGGVPVVGLTDPSVPIVRFRATYTGGDRVLSPTQNGQAAILAGVLNRDTQIHTQHAIQHALESLGASVEIAAEREAIVVDVVSPVLSLPRVLAIVSERLRHPRLTTDNVQPVIQQAQADILAQRANLDALADQAVLDHFYGENTPESRPILGRGPIIQTIQTDDLKNRYRELIRHAPLGLSVVGAVTSSDLNQIVSTFKLTSQRPIGSLAVTSGRPTPAIVVVDVPGATQADLRVCLPGVPYDVTGNFYRVSLFNYPIGGHFNATINQELRERRGVTYGAYGIWNAGQRSGYYEVASAVKVSAVGDAAQAVLGILRHASRTGLSGRETTELIQSLTRREALRYETQQQRLDVADRIQRYQLPTDFLSQRLALLSRITPAELNRVGQDLYGQPASVIVVGDWDQVAPQLQSLGLPIVRRSARAVIW